MDQLEAYKILELEPGSPANEIKAAYARMSKEFHPEEYPDEFQRIHEAYVILSRASRRGRNLSENMQAKPRQQGTEARQQRDLAKNENSETRQPRDPVKNENSETGQPRDSVKQENSEAGQQCDPVKNENSETKQQRDPVKQENSEARQQRDLEERRRRQNPPWTQYEWERPQMEQEQVRQYRFDEALERAQEAEADYQHQMTMRALAEMDILLSPQYRNKMKMFRIFFSKEDYQAILREPEFMRHFSVMLEGTQLKGVIYDYFIDYYRLRGLNPHELNPEAASLYYVLDRKRGMNAKKKDNISYAIPGGIVAGLRAGFHGTNMKTVFGVLILIALLATAMIWLYRKLYENHSSIFAQAVIAGIVFVTQIIALFGDWYAPVIPNDGGILLAFFLWAVSCIWLIILGIAAVILKIRYRR